MKLSELIELLDSETDVTFEIIEETYPTGHYAKDVLKKYPKARDYEVKKIAPAWWEDEGNFVPTLHIQVTNRKDDKTCQTK